MKGQRLARRIRFRKAEVNKFLLWWSLGLIPILGITFTWLLDESLPWLGWHGYGRASFLLLISDILFSHFGY